LNHKAFLTATPHNGYPESFSARSNCWTTSGSPAARLGSQAARNAVMGSGE